ncbi:hypothetical protein [Asanoa iriomotensis]|uniref:Asparagine synthase (Glutamine-hydrolysing) n=1 Tax=Asanoa iriomotensis TaxID=234613 RepID=A0ABQ4BZ70_9ACTN|nr:hypothetical protein [Asanoa iriomotensis]GIF55832.1 hypothetical protein Air01nite_19270 [Asanoa iriomotensis]
MPDSYARRDLGGDDWGVTVLHCADQGAYRWPTVAAEGPLTAVSLGLPVGIDVSGGPVALARRLLAGEDAHTDVVPPFGLVAVDEGERVSVQQDWLGMCRLFTAKADGVTVVCTRPSLVAAFLHGTAAPDLDGWASYAVCGHFGGELSPIRGVRQLRPGERMTGRRREGGWEVASTHRPGVDDLVANGFAAQARPVRESLDAAADALKTTAASIHDLYGDRIILGLSGGKDSRLIAASLVAAGRLPRFVTNEDTRAEGEIARQLVALLREKRGLAPEHTLQLAGAPANVLTVGLAERARRLQRQHDYQFPSTYLARPAQRGRLPERPRGATFTGAAGELATGYWYPPADSDVPPDQAAVHRLLAAAPPGFATEEASAGERRRVTALVEHAKEVGLRDLHLIDYLYLVERVRRWYTSAYTTGMVTPFLSPGFVAATFALTAAQKRERLLHTGLIRRLVPEWSEVPFVSASTGGSTATRVWQGDGIEAIADLLDTAHGPITELIHRDTVARALRVAARGGRPDPRTLQQFTALAVASTRLEPDATRPGTSATYAALARIPRQRAAQVGPHPRIVGRLRWVKKTRLGRRIWSTVRSQVHRRDR